MNLGILVVSSKLFNCDIIDAKSSFNRSANDPMNVDKLNEVNRCDFPKCECESRCVVCCDTDVDECVVNNGGCSPYANCTNTPGNYTCTCIGGYTGDGVNCSGLECRKILPSLFCVTEFIQTYRSVGTNSHSILQVQFYQFYCHLTVCKLWQIKL